MDATEKDDERITRAAVLVLDNSGSFIIYVGKQGDRHSDVFKTIGPTSSLPESTDDVDQGFWTSRGVYVNRKRAGEVAFASGQITKPTFCLMSEDVW